MSRDLHPNYTEVMPSKYTGLSSCGEWISRLPAGEVSGGNAGLFDDARIHWLIKNCGGIDGFNVMELGPFEGGHTFMLHQYKASSIDAVEAKRDFYLKCLCVKEAFELVNAHIYLGSFVEWLKREGLDYDLIVASGVLYHMTDPVGLLDLLSRSTARLFLWSHYAPRDMYPDGHPLRAAYAGVEFSDHKGHTVKLHKRTYLDASENVAFCGGLRDDHYWLEREDILGILARNGFTRFETEDQQNHPNGPCFCVYAEKRVV